MVQLRGHRDVRLGTPRHISRSVRWDLYARTVLDTKWPTMLERHSGIQQRANGPTLSTQVVQHRQENLIDCVELTKSIMNKLGGYANRGSKKNIDKKLKQGKHGGRSRREWKSV
ncbi:hypothetical protein AMECASPLE_039800 [Ameca splendens]|uniref:Uncharacterized protein n=1 Tax=Ameca splendens TaxID=208324 RepID=A0ABV0XLR4_9TELE